MNLLDAITLLAYVGLNADIILQVRKLRSVRSSLDISITGLTIRMVAILIILYKLICVGDTSLIVGQTLMALTFVFYFILAIRYLPKPKKRR
jgi:hypothetical protein